MRVQLEIPTISYTASQNLPPTYDSLKHENVYGDTPESIHIRLNESDKSLPQYDAFILMQQNSVSRLNSINEANENENENETNVNQNLEQEQT